MVRKRLLRTGVVAFALTLLAVFVPVAPAMADSGGGCQTLANGRWQACISVAAGTSDPLRGDGYYWPNCFCGDPGVHGEIHISQYCNINGASSDYGPLWWYMPGEPHSPVAKVNHMSCPAGHGSAYTYIKIYNANWSLIYTAYSYQQYF